MRKHKPEVRFPNKSRPVHGLSYHKLMGVWDAMVGRCYRESTLNFHRYGGRGISVCNEWRKFITFYEWAVNNGYAEGLQIDRKNNDGNYEPGNCRWVTSKENVRNRDVSKVKANGVEMLQCEWSDKIGVKANTIATRKKRGWTGEDLILGRPPKPIVIQVHRQTRQKVGVYNSVSEAEQITGVNSSSISACIKNQRKSAGGFIWWAKSLGLSESRLAK